MPITGQTAVKAVRFHHHVILKCQLTRDEIEGCWVRKKKRMGTTNADRLQMDKSSLEALANYLMKYPKRKHRWRRTRGIRDPILPTPNDSKYTRRGIERIAKDPTKLHSPEFWDYASKHRHGNQGCCPPTEADRIIREFYGIPMVGIDLANGPDFTAYAKLAQKQTKVSLADFL